MKNLNATLAALAVTSVLALGTAGFAADKAGAVKDAPRAARGFRGAATEMVTPDERPERPERPGIGIPGGNGPGGQHGMRPDHPPFAMIKFWENEEIVAALGLTEEQIAALADSHALTVESLEASEGSVMEAHDALRAAMEVDEPVLADVNAAIDEVTAAINEKMKILSAHKVVVRTVLTAEQEEGLREYVRENRPPRPDRPERPGRPGDDEGSDGRPERPGRPGDEIRDVIHEFAALVGPMLEDGTIDTDEQALIDEAIVEYPEAAQRVIRKVIERWVQNGSVPQPGERPDRPDRPERPARPGEELPELP